MIKILVIDDDHAVRRTICENLSESGYDVLDAADGDQGLNLIDPEAPPSLVVTDIIMPRKEGLETIIEIRKKFPQIKLIAISGGGRTRSTDFLALAKRLGSDAIIPKPIDMDQLEKTIKSLVG
jgi:DNA-binding response OmpR family regulator